MWHRVYMTGQYREMLTPQKCDFAAILVGNFHRKLCDYGRSLSGLRLFPVCAQKNRGPPRETGAANRECEEVRFLKKGYRHVTHELIPTNVGPAPH